LKAKDSLQKLQRIQELALEIRRAQKIVEEAPQRIEEIETRFRERNAEYVAVKERHDALQQDQRTRSGDLQLLEENRKKFMDDLMQVKNQREYAALLKEIDAVKAQISENEEVILLDMEEIEKVKVELQNHDEHIQEERETVERERTDVERGCAEAERLIAASQKEREALERGLPAEIVHKVHQLERTRQGIFLSSADDGTCQSCFVRIRPQVFQEIKLVSKLHRCGSCSRFLYVEASLRVDPVERVSDGVEAVNGGAV